MAETDGSDRAGRQEARALRRPWLASVRDARRAGAAKASGYFAFVSYAHADNMPPRRWWRPGPGPVTRLHERLETYQVPEGWRVSDTDRLPGRLYPCFRDENELPTSASLNEQISSALAQSRYLIVYCTPRSARSRWVNAEVEQFASQHGPERVVFLVIEGQPDAGDSGLAQCLTEGALALLTNPSGPQPLIVDARKDRDLRGGAWTARSSSPMLSGRCACGT